MRRLGLPARDIFHEHARAGDIHDHGDQLVCGE